MRFGLVGNITVYGGAAGIFGYLLWESYNLSKSLPKIDQNHPVNEIIRESHNLHKMAIQNYKNKVQKGEKIDFDGKNMYQIMMEQQKKENQLLKMKQQEEEQNNQEADI